MSAVMEEPMLRPGAQALPVRGVRAERSFAADDWIADEVPVALEYNGISHAVMLATPLDLDDFALGFSLSEGILETPAELYGVEQTGSADGITLHLEVASAAFQRLKARRRSLAGRTGCGLCGTESLAQVVRALPRLPAPARARPPCIDRAAIARALHALPDRQALQQATGAVHAAAWCSAEGDLLLVREDVGRHNALDKLIGALADRRRAAVGRNVTPIAAPPAPEEAGFFVVTSRASFEMVQKTVAARVGLLVAVSAPTALAVQTAQRAGLTLVGFARGAGLSAYSHPERLAL